MNKSILEKIYQIVKFNIESEELTIEQIDTNLSSIGMSSIDFVRIIVGLEEEFDCEIPDSKLLISEMDTISKMYQAIVQCMK